MSIIKKRKKPKPSKPLGRPPLGDARRDRQHTVRLDRAGSDQLRQLLEQVHGVEGAAGVPAQSLTSESALIAAMVLYCVASPVAVGALLASAKDAAAA